MATQRIAEMLPEERPRERLLAHGGSTLKASELIAILLRVGTKGSSAVDVAEQLIRHFGSLEALSRAPIPEMAKVHGMGQTKAIQLQAAFSLSALLHKSVAAQRAIDQPGDVYELLGEEMRLLDREQVRVILLNTKHRIIGIVEVTRGTINESLFHPREAFRAAVAHQAYGIILVHNHPSGDPTPSSADHRVTQQLREAGQVLQIEVIDHVILGAPRAAHPVPYYSFKEAGRL